MEGNYWISMTTFEETSEIIAWSSDSNRINLMDIQKDGFIAEFDGPQTSKKLFLQTKRL